jgi:hypothetical protein
VSQDIIVVVCVLSMLDYFNKREMISEFFFNHPNNSILKFYLQD